MELELNGKQTTRMRRKIANEESLLVDSSLVFFWDRTLSKLWFFSMFFIFVNLGSLCPLTTQSLTVIRSKLKTNVAKEQSCPSLADYNTVLSFVSRNGLERQLLLKLMCTFDPSQRNYLNMLTLQKRLSLSTHGLLDNSTFPVGSFKSIS
jgi:hypothetical protein